MYQEYDETTWFNVYYYGNFVGTKTYQEFSDFLERPDIEKEWCSAEINDFKVRLQYPPPYERQ